VYGACGCACGVGVFGGVCVWCVCVRCCVCW